MKWLALSELKAGTPFVTRDGRLGVKKMGYTDSSRATVWFFNEITTEATHGDSEVLPLDPATLTSSLEELEMVRGVLGDRREESAALLEQERAKERERCAAVLDPVPGVALNGMVFRDRKERAAAVRALDPPPVNEYADLKAEVARLRAALEEILDDDAPRPRSTPEAIALKALGIEATEVGAVDG